MGFLLLARAVRTDDTRLVDNGDAYIDRADDGSWTIGNPGIAFTLTLTRDRALVPSSLADPRTGDEWLARTVAEPVLSVAGGTRTLNGQEFVFGGVTTAQYSSGVELLARYQSTDLHVSVERHYVCYSGTPVIESWTTFAPTDSRGVEVGQLPGIDLSLVSGRVRWVTGLQTPDTAGGSFTLQSMSLDDGASLQLGSDGRATEQAMPWFQVLRQRTALFGGVLWQGSWHLSVVRSGDALKASIGLPPFATTTAEPLETPHTYVGLSDAATQRASEAMRSFVMAAVRHGRAYTPLVTYNTWFTYGTAIDEDSMRAEIESAADLGIELFVVDAGWYVTGTDPSDFTTGLGVWEEDKERFPAGLRALSDLAHERGMKFGIWVEPERVDLRTVGKAGLARERWLATSGGRYSPGVSNKSAPAAQICLASPEARDWIMERLTRLIDDVNPDYLKWDNNIWVNCDRLGHGHGTADGNFAHNRGLLAILGELRQRYPDLLIENCSGGGNRLEAGMLAWTDTAWMDDRTFTAPHVRHNLEGLSVVMPPPTLLSFVFGAEWQDPSAGGADLTLSFRSRMPGILGATWRGGDLSDSDRAGIRREIQIYKDIRDTVSGASATLLTPQVSEDDQSHWDVLQETDFASGISLVFAYQNVAGADHVHVHPQGLRPDTRYTLLSVDGESFEPATGSDLVANGIRIDASTGSRAHIIELRPSLDLSSSPSR
jgi:alpha-galactosidase